MKNCLLRTLFVAGLLSQEACNENIEVTTVCYTSRLGKSESVRSPVFRKPHYKGGHDSLMSFLNANIKVERFKSQVFQNAIFHDTARIRFIVSMRGSISDLSVSQSKHQTFKDEVSRVIKKSACNWVSGETDIAVNSWHQFDLYISLYQVSSNEVQTTITINDL